MLTNEQKENIKFILSNYSHTAHLSFFKDWGITGGTKATKIEKLITYLDENAEKISEFNSWFNSFFADGANNLYVFDSLQMNKANLKNQFDTLEHVDLINLTPANIDRARCIEKKDKDNKYVLRFVIDAKIMYKEENEGIVEPVIDDILYFYTVILDFDLEQIIISMPHTTGLYMIFNRQISRGNFKEVANHILHDINTKLGNISTDTCSEWIYDALDAFAEDGTAHNNPEITALCEKNKAYIKDFATRILLLSGIQKENIVNNLCNGICDLYENSLIETMGIVENDDYQAFKQNGDGVNSFFNVGSKTSSLRIGTEAAIAKKVRQISEVNILGVMKIYNGIVERFLIVVDSLNTMDFYMVRTDTSRFIREEMLYDVVRKVASYKEAN